MTFESGPGGLVRAAVNVPAAEAHVYVHGAHVTHYRAVGHSPSLFLSSRSRYAAGAAIRGGVPVIFPWFGARAGHPDSPDHGFARTSQWTVDSVERRADGAVVLAFGLEPDPRANAMWPHDFRLAYRVAIGRSLEMALEVENRSRSPFTFEEALHTYLFVEDARTATISGLESATYIDKTDAMKRKTTGPGSLRLSGATDRVFPGATATCTVSDPGLRRRLVVEKRGSATTVVWNPWSDRASAMADLGPEEWRSMLCVEAANTAADAPSLDPGQHHTMSVTIREEGD